MEAKLPAKGEWFTRSNRGSAAAARYADRPTDTIRVADVNEAAGEIHCERFDGFDAAGAMVIGRRTTIRFATWLSDAGRYTPCDPPAAPVPEMLDREQTEKRLLDDGADPEWIAEVMREPRVVLSWVADTAPRRVLRAHVRWLDAQAAPPVAVFVAPEPTLADVLASNEALRGEVAGLRADFRALVDAIKAGGQLPLFRVAA